MARINITGVSMGSKDFTVHMVLTEEQEVDGQMVDNIFGEAFVLIPHMTEMADVKTKIVDAATGIMKSHKDAVQKKLDIKEIDFPPIT